MAALLENRLEWVVAEGHLNAPKSSLINTTN